jgi:hypothetical protein
VDAEEFRNVQKAGFHFVPEGHAIVARRFIAGLAIHRICVPEGRLKFDLGCCQSGVPDRFEVKNSIHPHSEFRRPSGTQAMWSRTPAINRRAGLLSSVPPGRKSLSAFVERSDLVTLKSLEMSKQQGPSGREDNRR